MLGKKLSYFIFITALFLSGCAENSAGKTDIHVDETEPAKGRYLETSYDLPAAMTDYTRFIRTEDGTLLSADYKAGVFSSEDDGVSWKEDLETGCLKNEYDKLLNISVGPDRSILFTTYTDASHYYYIDAEGNEKELSFQKDLGEDILKEFYFFEDGSIYTTSMEGIVYEVDIGASALHKLFEAETEINYLISDENYLICSDMNKFYIYNLSEKKLQEQDEVLNQFLVNHLMYSSTGHNYREGGYSYIFCAGEEPGTIYLLCKEGLFRHILYGNIIEKIIEGSFCSIGDPRYEPVSMEVMKDGTFLVLFNRGKAAHYVYDEETYTVPQEELFIYGLTENELIKQAVSVYQKEHSDVYIRYETEFTDYELDSESNTVTKADAVRKLNQILMSDNSPDILILDELPYQSYIEKGVLADITDVLEGFHEKYPGEEIFDNIVGGIRNSDSVYMIPCQFSLPVIAGRKELVSEINDLESFAGQMEKERKNLPKGRILCVPDAEQLLRLFGMVSVSAWKTEDGNLDETALAEFYTQVNQIYQTEREGITQNDVDIYLDYIKESGYSIPGDEFYLKNSNNCPDLFLNGSQISLGYTKDIIVDYSDITSLLRLKEDYAVEGWNGQSGRTFLPNTLIGICKKMKEPELSEDFIQFLLTAQIQGLGTDNGFPVNKKSFAENLINKWDSDYIASYFYTDADGNELEYPLYWPDDNHLKKLMEIAQEAENPCIPDSLLEEVVYQSGIRFLNGEITVSEAVNEVKSRLTVYQGR